ncbi:MAG: signal peptidase II [Gemmatimonadaceae bacterium]
MLLLALAAVAGGMLAMLDRLTKAVVVSRLAPGAGRRVAPGVRVMYVRHRLNRAIVDRQRVGLVALFCGTVVTLLWLASGAAFFKSPVAAAGLGLAVAGASCNLWDRVRHHAFIDFICIGRWPAFNVADAGVCIGAALALWHLA